MLAISHQSVLPGEVVKVLGRDRAKGRIWGPVVALAAGTGCGFLLMCFARHVLPSATRAGGSREFWTGRSYWSRMWSKDMVGQHTAPGRFSICAAIQDNVR